MIKAGVVDAAASLLCEGSGPEAEDAAGIFEVLSNCGAMRSHPDFKDVMTIIKRQLTSPNTTIQLSAVNTCINVLEQVFLSLGDQCSSFFWAFLVTERSAIDVCSAGLPRCAGHQDAVVGCGWHVHRA